MSTGTVQRFDDAIGFGVIVDDADGGELFVHRGSLRLSGATINAGDRVEFDVHEGGMGQHLGVSPSPRTTARLL